MLLFAEFSFLLKERHNYGYGLSYFNILQLLCSRIFNLNLRAYAPLQRIIGTTLKGKEMNNKAPSRSSLSPKMPSRIHIDFDRIRSLINTIPFYYVV